MQKVYVNWEINMNLASHIKLSILVQINFGGFTWHQFMSNGSSRTVPTIEVVQWRLIAFSFFWETNSILVVTYNNFEEWEHQLLVGL